MNLVLLDIFAVKYCYMYIFMIVLLTFIPLMSPGFVGVIAAFITWKLYPQEENYHLVVLGSLCYFLSGRIQYDVYNREVRIVHSYILSLALAMGLYAFGIAGFLYGPILVCLLQGVIDLFKQDVIVPQSESPKKPLNSPDIHIGIIHETDEEQLSEIEKTEDN